MITAKTSSGTTTYTYDYQNQLTNVEANGVMVATYTHNALGQRIGIKDNDTQTWTVYNGNSADANPYADFSSSGSLQTRYLDGLAVDQIYGQTSSSGSTEWYLADQLGSVVAIASTSAVLDQITYDPFGNIVTQTNATDAVRFGFAGMEYDSTTGLYYDHARYYNSVTGRFVSQDPMGFKAGDTNLYRYAGNAPTVRNDPSGEIAPILVGAGLGFLNGVGSELGNKGLNLDQWNWNYIGGQTMIGALGGLALWGIGLYGLVGQEAGWTLVGNIWRAGLPELMMGHPVATVAVTVGTGVLSGYNGAVTSPAPANNNPAPQPPPQPAPSAPYKFRTTLFAKLDGFMQSLGL
jgi:RHS repeat-associated protein